MSCCRPSADVAGARKARRGLSLIEVMVSQSMALIVISAMLSLVVAMINRMQAETATSDAQVRLRQVTHLLLRDTQGVGATTGASTGDIVYIVDGGTTGSDTFTVFKRDESVCGGGLAATAVATFSDTVLPIEPVNGACPLATTSCPVVDINARSVQLVGLGRTFAISGQTRSNCNISLPTGAAATATKNAYNARYGTNHADLKAVLNEIKPRQVLFGSNFTYRVNASTLERSTDGGVSFMPVLNNVFDLQVVRVYVTAAGVEHRVTGSTGSPLPTGVVETDFVGLRLGVMTFSKTRDGVLVSPPSKFGNRDVTATPGVRYRSSFVFAASRNRGA